MTKSNMIGIVVAFIVGVVGGHVIFGSMSQPPIQNKSASESTMTQTQFTPPKTNEEKITNAMSAAPLVIAKDATIIDWPAKDGDQPVSLRAGTNGWTCLPDYPVSPGNDPFCGDAIAMQWFGAYLGHKVPKISQFGLAYMLQGGSDPSNTDPYATEPKQGESWMSAPPHVMIFPTQKLDVKVFGTDPDSGNPWIMWANTPYEHIMMPVK